MYSILTKEKNIYLISNISMSKADKFSVFGSRSRQIFVLILMRSWDIIYEDSDNLSKHILNTHLDFIILNKQQTNPKYSGN